MSVKVSPTVIRRRRAIALTAATAVLAAIVVPLIVLGGSGQRSEALYSAAKGDHGLHVVPFPGTPDASPQSVIVFSSLHQDDIRSVSVTGSQSGEHRGTLRALGAARGVTFLPAAAFKAGEHVSVQATLSSPEAGSASGARGAQRLSFGFTVATPGASIAGTAKTTTGSGGSGSQPSTAATPSQSFHSQPSLRPPVVRIASDSVPSAGDIFLAPNNGTQVGPMILNGRGQLVWFDPLQGVGVFNLQVQRYRRKPVLTWWQGKVITGHGVDGRNVILDSSYRLLAVFGGGEGYSSDLHVFQLTPQGTALVTVYSSVKADLSSVGGPSNGSVLDSIVQEIDVKTGRVVWEWHALGHIALDASYSAMTTPYDYFHVNSVQQLPDGNLLISARNTWGVYEISRKTGKVIWELGGKYSTFKMRTGTNFEWQHDAQLAADDMLTVFDDAADPKKESESSGKQLALNFDAMSASLLHRYTHKPPVLAGSQGSVQLLAGGDVFVGWGARPEFSQYTADGKQIFDGSFVLPVQSYRAFRFSWRARPAEPPALAVTGGARGAPAVYASWNGATGVYRWELLAGRSSKALRTTGYARSTGFETAIGLPKSARYVAVRALDSRGRVLGSSSVVAVTP